MRKKGKVLVLLAYNPTTLVYPPFEHAMGYHRAVPFYLKLFGLNIDVKEPYGIACCKMKIFDDPKTHADDDELTVIAVDRKNHRIIYNIKLVKLKALGKMGRGKGKFYFPTGVECSVDGDVWVCDWGNNRVVHLVMTPDSLAWDTAFGFYGIFPGEFDGPWDCAWDGEKLYVTDYGNNRVQVFTRRGRFLYEIKNLPHPTGIAVISEKERWNRFKESFIVVITDDGRKIRKLSLTGQEEREVYYRELELKDAYFSFPAIDYFSQIWVTDSKNHCIHMFTRNLLYVTSFGRKGKGDKEFISPRGIAIWKKFGQVFVVDDMGAQYYWMGVDGWVLGVNPDTFTVEDPGTVIGFYTTQPAYVKIEIFDENGKRIRKLYPGFFEEPKDHLVMWDGRNDRGEVVPGRYRIRIKLTPPYSSRGRFKKILETEVVCVP